jgi:hypothetical protein
MAIIDRMKAEAERKWQVDEANRSVKERKWQVDEMAIIDRMKAEAERKWQVDEANRSDRINSHIGAAAQDFPLDIKPRLNSELGLPVRTELEVRELVERHGVNFPFPERFKIKLAFEEGLAERHKDGARAIYGPQGKVEGPIFWDDREQPKNSLVTYFRNNDEGVVVVRLDKALLKSDEDLVAHVAHELYEIKQLETEYLGLEGLSERRAGESMSPMDYKLFTDSGSDNMHDTAWDYAGEAVRHMRMQWPYSQ